MDIKIGKYNLTNDERQYVVSEIKISTGEKTSGEEIYRNTTYHSSLDSALKNILERRIKESEATTIAELKKDFEDAVAWIKNQFMAGSLD